MLRLVRALKIAIHLALVFVAFLTAYELRLDLPIAWWIASPNAPAVVALGLLYAAIAGIVEIFLRTERSSWRYASVREVLRLALAMTITAAAFVVVVFLTDRAMALPRSTVVLTVLFSLSFMVGVRLLWRLRWNPSLALGTFLGAKRAGTPLTIVGEIRQAESYLRRWASDIDQSYRPIAIVTNERRSIGQLIHGVPVVGEVKDLVGRLTRSVARPDDAAVLFLADPIASLGLTTADIGRLRAESYRLLRQSSAVEVSVGEGAGPLREIELEEFLPRSPQRLDPEPLAALISGRRVLVTGAGGSIGSEVARQLVRFGCSHLTLIDHSEFALFEIDRELQTTAGDRYTRRAVLCNVRDADRVHQVFITERPELVFHAAALKHVTLVEGNPAEAVLTNVLGTWNVAAAARDAGIAHMVMISTDKAVNPTSIMGCTKRLAESLLGGPAGDRTLYSIVRFGNVLGSAGSVVPIFRDQIERGGPITVTHPDVERYFMTIPEAVQLVLQATALRAADQCGAGLRKFVLEMGQPVKIVDLARQMIELSGEKDRIRIDFIGLRPGEKITETLVDVGEHATLAAPGIMEIETDIAEVVIGEAEIVSLAESAARSDAAVLNARVRALVQSVREPIAPKVARQSALASVAR